MTTPQHTPIRLAPPGEKGVPLMLVAQANAGIRKGARACAVLLSWQIAERALGRPLGDGQGTQAAVLEYTEWWSQHERTTWRDLAAFRQAFPSEETPARLVGLLRERQAATRRGVKGLGAVPVLA
jgi:hypothetical protein